ncbi:OLC1v1012562C1 [Oldenlandia corymbosa var. corymbosa]|uniref:OLC1v1012562C1 n=1 Tax=Oldenlandia corymbosa var. corymbosa TaxID=529605 RepID=A0AAV1DZF7_OLDCO|nr:OLC1v1012562C1 [Oldenlandia corymbosa var. corymbosa]
MSIKPDDLVISLPTQGHIKPLLQISKLIAAKGIKVTVVLTRSIQMTSQPDIQSELIKLEYIPERINQEEVPEKSAHYQDPHEEWFGSIKAKALENLSIIMERETSSAVDGWTLGFLLQAIVSSPQCALSVAGYQRNHTALSAMYGLDNLGKWLHQTREISGHVRDHVNPARVAGEHRKVEWKSHIVSHINRAKGHRGRREYKAVQGTNEESIRDAFKRAFGHWESITLVAFTKTDDYGFADIKIGFYNGDHDDGEAFENSMIWNRGPHKIGHLLGLAHLHVKESVMYPSLKPRKKKVDLKLDDIRGIQAL